MALFIGSGKRGSECFVHIATERMYERRRTIKDVLDLGLFATSNVEMVMTEAGKGAAYH